MISRGVLVALVIIMQSIIALSQIIRARAAEAAVESVQKSFDKLDRANKTNEQTIDTLFKTCRAGWSTR